MSQPRGGALRIVKGIGAKVGQEKVEELLRLRFEIGDVEQASEIPRGQPRHRKDGVCDI